jgi:hypothetical protein
MLLVLAFSICLPVTAGDVDPSLAYNELAIRQAHLSWVSEITDVQMNAAITFIGILYSTDTTEMNRIYQDYRVKEQRISTIESKDDLDLLITDLREITIKFRNETGIQLVNGQGKQPDLKAALDDSIAGNPYIENKKKAYWDLRADLQMKDFTTRIKHARTVLSDLNGMGYDTAAAQRTLDVIASKEPILKEALGSKSDTKVQSANSEIHELSLQLTDQVGNLQEQIPKDQKIRFSLDQADRAIGVADSINHDLVILILNIGPAEPILATAKGDIRSTRLVLDSGRIDAAATSLLLVKKDFRDLAVAYRGVATSAPIPRTTADTLVTMSFLLDSAADSMEVT